MSYINLLDYKIKLLENDILKLQNYININYNIKLIDFNIKLIDFIHYNNIKEIDIQKINTNKILYFNNYNNYNLHIPFLERQNAFSL